MSARLTHIRDGALLGALLVASGFVMLTANRGVVRSMQVGAMEATSWVEAIYAQTIQNLNAISENNVLR